MTELSEQEVRTRFIIPTIQQAGWQPKQIRVEVNFTVCSIVVRKQTTMRGRRRRLDYLLYRQANLHSNPAIGMRRMRRSDSLGGNDRIENI